MGSELLSHASWDKSRLESRNTRFFQDPFGLIYVASILSWGHFWQSLHAWCQQVKDHGHTFNFKITGAEITIKRICRVPVVYRVCLQKNWKQNFTLYFCLKKHFSSVEKLIQLPPPVSFSRAAVWIEIGSAAFWTALEALSGKNDLIDLIKKVSTNKSSHEKTHPCPIVLSKCSFTLNISCPLIYFFPLKFIQMFKTCLLESQHKFLCIGEVHYFILPLFKTNTHTHNLKVAICSLESDSEACVFHGNDHQSCCRKTGGFLCHQCLLR